MERFGFLADFIICELDLPYSFEEIDFLIRRAQQNIKHEKDHSKNNQRGPKPIFALLVNWRTAEEIRNWIIALNSIRRINVFVDQMYSKRVDTTKKWHIKVLS